MTNDLPAYDVSPAAMRLARQDGCYTCAHCVTPVGCLPTCIRYSSGYFGAARLPITGCDLWWLRDSLRATLHGLACTDEEKGSETTKGGSEDPPFTSSSGAGNTEAAFTTTPYEGT